MKTKNLPRFLPAILILLGIALLCASWFWYDATVDRSGWVEKDGIRYYRDFHAQPVSGWLDIDTQRYYFHDDGTVHTGWQDIGGQRYHFHPDGVMDTGWLTMDGETYYLGTNGAMHTGWQTLEGERFYFPEGKMATGWQDIDGQRYHFHPDGVMAKGFTEIGGYFFHFEEDGTVTTGDAVIDGTQYLFLQNGAMFTGWTDREDIRCYYLPDGALATGWQSIDGKWYFFADDGAMQTGWLTQGEYSYYLHPDGDAAVGPTEIDGATHYFSPRGIEVILVNARNPVPSYYEMDLVNVTGWHDVDARCYDALVQMLSDCNAAGIEYNFNSAYRSIAEQTTILELRTQEHMAAGNLDYSTAYAKALQTVAIPGTSEHHLGLAVDLLGNDAIAWFTEHCWDYGFIVRYTDEKKHITGIIHEPWHFRYVGTEVSLDMKDSGLCLEEYLGAV